MHSSLTVGSVILLWGALVGLAAIPSSSVLMVVSRSSALGLRHGLLTAVGIVAGDVVLITAALGGLSLIADAMGPFVAWLRDLGGVYLVMLGLSRCRSLSRTGAPPQTASHLASFSAGFALTLGDQKAILFYAGFLPAFLDLKTVSYVDAAIVLITAGVAVGGVKLTYAMLADRARSIMSPRISQALNAIAGGILIAVGVFIFIS
jgi:threonine/homoserine/homoserine lactone efflux protein